MRLSDILDVKRVRLPLMASSREQALRQLSELLVGDGISAEEIAAAFLEREQVGTTGVGSAVAFPHGRLEGVKSLRAAVGICEEGVEFRAVDGLPVRIFVALLGPKGTTEADRADLKAHLQALARFSKILRHAGAREELLAAKSEADVVALFLERE